MGKMGAYQPTEKYKNYSLPTSKPLKSHALYEEKVWTLPEQIYQKLKKVAEFMGNLYPKLTDDFSKNIKNIIEKNLKILIADLDLMQRGLEKNPDTFNSNKLKINQHCITEMKNICDNLQTVRSYEYEFKNLGKIKHSLHELENLIQPTSFEKNLEKARVKSKPKALAATPKAVIVKTRAAAAKPKAVIAKTRAATAKPKAVIAKTRATAGKPKAVIAKTRAAAGKPKAVIAKKEHLSVTPKKKITATPTVKSKKKEPISKKTEQKAKVLKPKKVASKRPNKSEAPVHALKKSEKKVTKLESKAKLPAKSVLKAKPKPKIKSSGVSKG
jgi:hypothetical protein